ncbi:MAG: response regulator transcription factor [Candidatus Glassbacteria bacterium]
MKKKILVVDDEPDTITTIQFILEQKGYNVITAINGYEALGAAIAEEPDLMILDVLLPKINGYEVSRIIKEESRRGTFEKELPVLILTGAKFSDSNKERLFRSWSMADAFMYKPFELDDLEKRVANLLENSK